MIDNRKQVNKKQLIINIKENKQYATINKLINEN